MAPITYKDKRYTIVFKNEVTEETVVKYMTDVVDAGGRLTQTYDWFLNGFCAAIPELHLQLLKSNNEIDYIEPEGLPKRL
ncbi:protease propeptide/inhibitor [Multifurca ochricompacta]|uniref:Protease propeptide/inhibitor n=1 Tax=Multifurca ochricompacta TaxID=376703 RepID=A0AAD4M8B3_9AGAM|nr:protease propeptide/inhibitor [Multifurca ochricompacta]